MWPGRARARRWRGIRNRRSQRRVRRQTASGSAGPAGFRGSGPSAGRDPVACRSPQSPAFYWRRLGPPGGDNSFAMPEQTKPMVSALVVSHNGREHLLQCLRAFYATADVPVEAVVVDNASTDGSAAAVTDEFPKATVLLEPKNLGYGRAANKGLERCKGRFALLLNPDVK